MQSVEWTAHMDSFVGMLCHNTEAAACGLPDLSVFLSVEITFITHTLFNMFFKYTSPPLLHHLPHSCTSSCMTLRPGASTPSHRRAA